MCVWGGGGGGGVWRGVCEGPEDACSWFVRISEAGCVCGLWSVYEQRALLLGVCVGCDGRSMQIFHTNQSFL